MSKVVVESEFEEVIRPRLSEEDDPKFWAAAFDTIIRDFEALYSDDSVSHEIFLQVGACSHWLRPHQSRLTVAGGFAYPSGYQGGSRFGDGLPEFDWFVILNRDRGLERWIVTEKFFGKRKLICRAALPTRTRRHAQAAVHVLWSPGTPKEPDNKLELFYGFRKIGGRWECVASKSW